MDYSFEFAFIIVFAIVLVIFRFLKNILEEKRIEKENIRLEEERKRDEEYNAFKREYLKEKQQELIKLREFHLSEIRAFNKEYMEKHGVNWSNEEKDMLEYDKRVLKDWRNVGMIPPSFQNKKR